MSAPNSQYHHGHEGVVNLQVPNLPASPSYPSHPPISFSSCCQPALPNMISLSSDPRCARSPFSDSPPPYLNWGTQDGRPATRPFVCSYVALFSSSDSSEVSPNSYLLYLGRSSHSSPNYLARYVGDQPQTPQSPLHDMYVTPNIPPEYNFNPLFSASIRLVQSPRLIRD